jgi:putative flippase GtrA
MAGMTSHASGGQARKGQFPWARGVARVPSVFGTGLGAQGLRFALAGTTVWLVNLSVTTVLAVVLGLPFQMALFTGYVVSVAVHFALQRLFVWAHREGFALSMRRQLGRYLLVAATQYGVTAVSTLLLPPLLGLSSEAVFLIVVSLQASINFLLFRNRIFHPRSTHTDAAHL